MRYSTRQYAGTLLAALSGKSEKEVQEVFRRFLGILARNGSSNKKKQILREAKKIYYSENRIREVEVETAGQSPQRLKEDLEEALGTRVVLEEKMNPEIVGGIKIVIDDEMLIDATLKTQLDRIFQRSR